MDYIAKFHINCGRTCLGGSVPVDDGEEITYGITRNSDQEAIRAAAEIARTLAVNYLSDPTIGKTRVKLSSLEESGREITPNLVVECSPELKIFLIHKTPVTPEEGIAGIRKITSPLEIQIA